MNTNDKVQVINALCEQILLARIARDTLTRMWPDNASFQIDVAMAEALGEELLAKVEDSARALIALLTQAISVMDERKIALALEMIGVGKPVVIPHPEGHS